MHKMRKAKRKVLILQIAIAALVLLACAAIAAAYLLCSGVIGSAL